jgi:D-alanine-D-alanine ligase-like ATP-grasp enzyme
VVLTRPGGLRRTNPTGHLELIRTAAEDRGLTTRKIGKTTWFFDGRWPVGGMTGWVPTLVGRQALRISHSKAETKRMLDAAGVPTPAGIAVGPDGFDDALTHLTAADRAMVLKPDRAKGGSGISCGITSETDLRAAWEVAKAADAGPTFLLEEQRDGVDIRAFVVGLRVVAATTRINPHVVGDGVRSLTELVEEKQHRRDEHTDLLGKYPIVVDAGLLQRCGRALDDVPARGDVVVLNSMGNYTVGGESVDVTELAHPDLLQMAIDAARAIPGLAVAGVDLLTPEIGSSDGAVVLEVNVQANVRLHHAPAYGKPRDVAGAIIDEMIATAGQRARHEHGPAPAREPGHHRMTTSYFSSSASVSVGS